MPSARPAITVLAKSSTKRVALYAADLCRMFGVEESRIVELVEEGVLSILTIDATELAIRRRRRCAGRASRCAWSATSASICRASPLRSICWRRWNSCAARGARSAR